MLTRTPKQANNSSARASTQPQKLVFSARSPAPHRLCWADFRPDKPKTREATPQLPSKTYLQMIAASKSGCWVVSGLNELDMKTVRVTFHLVAPVTHGPACMYVNLSKTRKTACRNRTNPIRVDAMVLQSTNKSL